MACHRSASLENIERLEKLFEVNRLYFIFASFSFFLFAEFSKEMIRLDETLIFDDSHGKTQTRTHRDTVRQTDRQKHTHTHLGSETREQWRPVLRFRTLVIYES